LSSKVIKARNVQLVAEGPFDTARFRHPGGERTNNLISGGAAVFLDHNGLASEDEKADRAGKQAYDQGFAAGVALQKEQSLTTLKALSQILREVGDLKLKLFADAEEQMLRLVWAVAEKVIYDEVSTNSQIVLGVLREAVKGVVDREGMKIHLNPQDFLFMMDMKADFLKEFNGVKNVIFEEDGEIQRGGALLETLAGEVDARLEQRVKEVKGALKIR
jgi:flagellar biosynthesis/type III secretory pathway protein FliH